MTSRNFETEDVGEIKPTAGVAEAPPAAQLSYRPEDWPQEALSTIEALFKQYGGAEPPDSVLKETALELGKSYANVVLQYQMFVLLTLTKSTSGQIDPPRPPSPGLATVPAKRSASTKQQSPPKRRAPNTTGACEAHRKWKKRCPENCPGRLGLDVVSSTPKVAPKAKADKPPKTATSKAKKASTSRKSGEAKHRDVPKVKREAFPRPHMEAFSIDQGSLPGKRQRKTRGLLDGSFYYF